MTDAIMYTTTGLVVLAAVFLAKLATGSLLLGILIGTLPGAIAGMLLGFAVFAVVETVLRRGDDRRE